MSTNDRVTVEDGSESLLQTSNARSPGAGKSHRPDVGLSCQIRRRSRFAVKHSCKARRRRRLVVCRGASLSCELLLRSPPVTGHQRALGRIALGRELSPGSMIGTGAFRTSASMIERQGSSSSVSLPSGAWSDFESAIAKGAPVGGFDSGIDIGGERYLASFVELPGDHPVRPYSLQSFDRATSFLSALKSHVAHARRLGGRGRSIDLRFSFPGRLHGRWNGWLPPRTI